MSGTAPAPVLTAEENERQEQAHYREVLRAFKFYRQHAEERIARAKRSFDFQSAAHKRLLEHMPAKLDRLQACANANADVMEAIADNSGIFNVDMAQGKSSAERPSQFNMDKVYTTLKQYVRDWSTEGAAERDRCYKPLLDEVQRLYAGRDRAEVSILVPGSGLGRLAWECAKQGHRCEGWCRSTPVRLPAYA